MIKMEDDQNGKKDQNGRQPKWKTTKMENQNERKQKRRQYPKI